VHYFKFDIEKWVQSTRHLLPEEEGVYLRIALHYYDTEHPLPLDNRMMLKRLQLLSYQAVVDDILAEFFVKTEKGWFHKKIEVNLKTYRKNRKINKDNGARGGRPRLYKALMETENKPDGLLNKTEQKPDAKAISNYELGTKNDKSTRAGKNGKFKIPKPDEVQAYLDELGETRFTGQQFHDSNQAKGWVVGRNRTPMKDWKAAVRTWRKFRNDEDKPQSPYAEGAI